MTSFTWEDVLVDSLLGFLATRNPAVTKGPSLTTPLVNNGLRKSVSKLSAADLTGASFRSEASL